MVATWIFPKSSVYANTAVKSETAAAGAGSLSANQLSSMLASISNTPDAILLRLIAIAITPTRTTPVAASVSITVPQNQLYHAPYAPQNEEYYNGHYTKYKGQHSYLSLMRSSFYFGVEIRTTKKRHKGAFLNSRQWRITA